MYTHTHTFYSKMAIGRMLFCVCKFCHSLYNCSTDELQNSKTGLNYLITIPSVVLAAARFGCLDYRMGITALVSFDL